MYSILCANTNHDITTFEVDRMVLHTKELSKERNKTFP